MNRIMIAGTHSGCGKTTVTCGILQALVNRKIKTSAFKCGPDYIDPIFHRKIIGINSGNLDGYFCNKDTLNYLLSKCDSDCAVIEGVMGYYDGAGKLYSSFKTAEDTDTPVIIVIDSKGMSNSIGAVMQGFLTYEQPNKIVGFIFNRLPESLVGMAEELCKKYNTEYFGRMPFDENVSIESRHLGLIINQKTVDYRQKMQLLSELAEQFIDIDKILIYSQKTETLKFEMPNLRKIVNNNVKIAVAEDEAFCFLYRENIEVLENLGCEIVKFSPLKDKSLPKEISGIIFPGGYPELYSKELSENHNLKKEIKNKILSGIPVIAECGGFMYLHEALESKDGKFFPMIGIIKGRAFRTKKLQRFGYVKLTSNNDNILCKKGESFPSHEFHYWDSTDIGSDFTAEKASRSTKYACIHANETMYAGYPHLYFYGNINCAMNFVIKCESYWSKNGQNRTNKTS